jgi:ribonuclease J
MGIPAENMVLIDNGFVVELTKESIRIAGKVQAGIEPVDASRSGVVKDETMKERRQLAEEGIVTMAVAVGTDGKLLARPEIHLKGVVNSVNQASLQEQLTQTIETVLSERWTEFARTFDSEIKEVDWEGLKVQVERSIQRVLRREIASNPLLVLLVQIPDEEPATKLTGRRRPRSTARVAS